MKNLAHSASFESLDKDAPSKAETKHLASLSPVPPRAPVHHPAILDAIREETILGDAGRLNAYAKKAGSKLMDGEKAI